MRGHTQLGIGRMLSSNSMAREELHRKSWCNDVYENDDEESSIASDFSSSVGIHRTPSNGFEDYTKRRETFLARIGSQPQDVDNSDCGRSYGANTSERKRVKAYEERKQATENRDRVVWDLIRLERKQFVTKINQEQTTMGMEAFETEATPSKETPQAHHNDSAILSSRY